MTDLHDDDAPIGRVLTRREMLALLGGAGALIAGGTLIPQIAGAQSTPTPTPSATALPSCIVRPELTEGPFFIDGLLERADIRLDRADNTIKDGALLKLKFIVQDVAGGVCSPIEGAQVDVWHCDALGVYSGVRDRTFNTTQSDFLRGWQRTDEFGAAEFVTILPGWYPGRAVHIHFKIRTEPDAARGYEFTSQLFFEPEQVEAVYRAHPAYAAKGATPDTPNSRDGIYRQSGDLLTLTLVEEEPSEDETEESGYTAAISIGLDRS
jgi:protocatechuate 3,4-dioxygenase beta subunit